LLLLLTACLAPMYAPIRAFTIDKKTVVSPCSQKQPAVIT